MKRDIFKREINIGDKVAFNHPGYRYLRIGQVIAFTPKMVRVQYSVAGKEESTLKSGDDLVVDPT